MIRIGKIVATQGLTGELIITHLAGKKTWLKTGDALFVALKKESYIPFFVSSVKSVLADELIVLFEDTASVEAAKKLVGKEVFVAEDILAKSGADSPLLWIGFIMKDKEAGELGTIKDVYQTRNQWLAEVDYRGSEVLVPLVPPVLVKSDIKTKTVHVALPDGLLEVYS
jgi:16S rRNA processing protein RimM